MRPPYKITGFPTLHALLRYMWRSISNSCNASSSLIQETRDACVAMNKRQPSPRIQAENQCACGLDKGGFAFRDNACDICYCRTLKQAYLTVINVAGKVGFRGTPRMLDHKPRQSTIYRKYERGFAKLLAVASRPTPGLRAVKESREMGDRVMPYPQERIYQTSYNAPYKAGEVPKRKVFARRRTNAGDGTSARVYQ